MHTGILIAGAVAMFAGGPPCPVGPAECPIPALGPRNAVRVQPVPLLQESGLDTTENGFPPTAFTRLPLGPFVVELWAQQAAGYCDGLGGETPCLPGNPITCSGEPDLCEVFGSGLSAVHTDVLFDGTAINCTGLGTPGPFSTAGTCGFGFMDEFGGCTNIPELGMTTDWVRIGTIRMVALEAGSTEILTAPADTAIAVRGCGTIADTRVFYGSTPVFFFPPQVCGSPADCPGNDNLCDGVDICFGSQCIPLPESDIDCPGALVCDPSDGACKECFVNGQCGDGDPCTHDFCIAEACSNPPVDCEDADPCTIDGCDEDTGICLNDQIPCPPGLLCNSVDGECTAPCALPCDLPNPPYILPIHADLELAPWEITNASFGQIIEIGLFAEPEFPLIDTLVAGINVIFEWDPEDVRLVGVLQNGPYEWTEDVPPFPDDCQIDCLNGGLDPDGIPFNDGDALFEVLGQFQSPVGQGPAVLPPAGMLIATLQFEVIAANGVDSRISIVPIRNVTCSQVLWGGIEFRCLFNDFPCDPTNPFSCGGSDFCVPDGTIPGCNIIGNVDAVRVLGPCESTCADVDEDGITDDLCVFQACELDDCQLIDRVFADMGGPFGNCMIDGTADGNDRFHALNCFANINPEAPPPATYPCEPQAPNALNVDAGGAFGDCAPDGVCDGNDAFAALNAFGGQSTCSCPLDGGPSPTAIPTVDAGKVALAAVAARPRLRPGDLVEVDVVLSSGFDDLRGYQLHLAASGGSVGSLELVDITVTPQRRGRRGAIKRIAPNTPLPAGQWTAFNRATGQMVAGIDGAGVDVPPDTVLATFIYRASKDARGKFAIEVLVDSDDPLQRTFIFPTPAQGRVLVERATAATIRVEPMEPSPAVR